jgi:hypothetical protein
MLVLAEDAAEAVMSADIQRCEPIRLGDWFGQRSKRSGVRDPLMWSVKVIEPLVLPQRVEQIPLVPDQHPVQQFPAAGSHPPFHDSVHAGPSGRR